MLTDVCTDRREHARNKLVTTNAIYRCEELEDAVSVYDTIIEENHYAGATEEGFANVYLDVLSDETEEGDQGTKPPVPMPRPETETDDRDRAYEGLKDKKPEHVYLQLLSDNSQECYQRTKAENVVQDTKAQDEETKLEEQAQDNDIQVKTTALNDAKQTSAD